MLEYVRPYVLNASDYAADEIVKLLMFYLLLYLLVTPRKP